MMDSNLTVSSIEQDNLDDWDIIDTISVDEYNAIISRYNKLVDKYDFDVTDPYSIFDVDENLVPLRIAG